MGTTGPSLLVKAPLAAPPVYGLIAASRVIPEMKPHPADLADKHWQNGITYEPEGCTDGWTYDPCEHDEHADPIKADNVEWFPYGHAITEVCSTFSHNLEDEAERNERLARVQRQLLGDSERALGAELWSGERAQAGTAWPNTWLTDDPLILGGGAVAAMDALACLETYLSHNNGGSRGMIHAPAGLVTIWDAGHALEIVNGVVYTINGNIVIGSSGYPGTSPSDTIGTGNVWAYATDIVRVWRSAPQTFDLLHTVDRLHNTVEVQSQEIFLAEWERCRLAGVRCNVPVCEGGS